MAASQSRTQKTLNALALALLLAVGLHGVEATALQGASIWKSGAVTIGVLLSGALLLVWSWRWQLLLVLTVVPGTLLSLWHLAPPGGDLRAEFASLALALGAAGVVSVVGAWLSWGVRRNVAAWGMQYRHLFEEAVAGIAVLDTEGRVLDVNRRLASLLGTPLEEIRGSQFGHWLAERQPAYKSGDELLGHCLALALAGQRNWIVADLVDHAGRRIEAEMCWGRIELEARPAVQVIVSDLSERLRSERRRERLRRFDVLSRLVGSIAYRFSQLLAAIEQDARRLGDLAEEGPDRELADAILDSVTEGMKLSRELMGFGVFHQLNLQPVKPEELLFRVEAMTRAWLPPEVAIRLDWAPQLPELAGDPDHLTHAVTQLLQHWQGASLSLRQVTLSAGLARVGSGEEKAWPPLTEAEYLRLSVSVEGEGVGAASMERVFEALGVDPAGYERERLGLPAVYGVIRAHQGEIQVESDSEGKATVHLLLPLWREQGEGLQPPTEAAVRLYRGSVLIVDRDELMRRAARKALEKLGYRVLEAGDMEAVGGRLSRRGSAVDLLLLDATLAEEGQQFLTQLEEQGVRVPIVLGVPAYSKQSHAFGEQLGGRRPAAVVSKPYEPEELASAVSRVLAEFD